MARKWWRPLWLSWGLYVVPILALELWLLRDAAGWALLVLWWQKPLFERIPLYVASRSLFGNPPRQREVLQALPGLFSRGFFGAMLWERFGAQRSVWQPIRQLEQLQGQALALRRKGLLARVHNVAATLTVTCFFLELALCLGFWGLAFLFTPDALQEELLGTMDASSFFESFGKAMPAAPLFLALAQLLIGPLYACAGFGLYLDRRTDLEGWDIELAFRKLTSRIAARSRHAAGWIVLLLAGLLVPLPASADEAPEAQKAIQEVLQMREFQTHRKEKRWVSNSKETKDSDDLNLAPLAAFGAAVASAIKWIFYVTAPVVLLWGAYLLFRSFERRRVARKQPPPLVQTAGAQSSPPTPQRLEHPVQAARALWAAGRAGEALGVLYRSALWVLVQDHHLKLAEGATEAECVARVQSSAPHLAAPFRTLTRTWQSVAYAHRRPDDAQFESLCAEWSRTWEKAA